MNNSANIAFTNSMLARVTVNNYFLKDTPYITASEIRQENWECLTVL